MVGKRFFFLRFGESIFSRSGVQYHLENTTSNINHELIEDQMFDYVGEDDVIGFDDFFFCIFFNLQIFI